MCRRDKWQIIIIIIIIVIEFLTSQPHLGNIHLSLDIIINRIRLDGLIYSLKKFLTTEHVPRMKDLCICLYVFGCKLSLFRLCDSDFRITPLDDIVIGITWAAFCLHIAHISFANSWYLFCLSIIILARLYYYYYLFEICWTKYCIILKKYWRKCIMRQFDGTTEMVFHVGFPLTLMKLWDP
jgi:hypothetical protein